MIWRSSLASVARASLTRTSRSRLMTSVSGDCATARSTSRGRARVATFVRRALLTARFLATRLSQAGPESGARPARNSIASLRNVSLNDIVGCRRIPGQPENTPAKRHGMRPVNGLQDPVLLVDRCWTGSRQRLRNDADHRELLRRDLVWSSFQPPPSVRLRLGCGGNRRHARSLSVRYARQVGRRDVRLRRSPAFADKSRTPFPHHDGLDPAATGARPRGQSGGAPGCGGVRYPSLSADPGTTASPPRTVARSRGCSG